MSDADRIAELERDLTDVRIENAGLRASLEHLATAVTGLTTVVQDLRDTMNRGKGAIGLFAALSGALGGLLAWAAGRIFH